MEKDDEFLHTFFCHLSQLAFDKAKEHLVNPSDITLNKLKIFAFFFRKKTKKRIDNHKHPTGICFLPIYNS